MCDISIPKVAPEIAPLKLVTMTISVNLGVYLNLHVIAKHISLSDTIKSISFRDIKKNIVQKEEDSQKFKNQCSFNIDIGDKMINTKIFNNGKLVNVGCLTPIHAQKTAKIVTELIHRLNGEVTFPIITEISKTKNRKKFFKDDLRKKFNAIIQILACQLDIPISLDPFDVSISADEAFMIFQEESEKPNYEKDLMYIYTIISILKNYYDEVKIIDYMDTVQFKNILNLILKNTDREKGYIKCVFSSYLDNSNLIDTTNFVPKVVLINKSTNSLFYINRASLTELAINAGYVCVFDKSRYPGVILEYETSKQCGSKTVKIIFFNTGKINITAANTHEQVDEAYEFTKVFCRENFNEIILQSEYFNKIKAYEDSRPDQFYVGKIDEQNFYLLKKSHILSNPRNLKLLKSIGYLPKYWS